MSENISYDDFAAQLNTKFRVFRETAQFEAELIEVRRGINNARQESFSLFFLMPEDFPVEQGNFSFEHERLDSMEIFAVPIEKNAPGGIVFQAVFNRLILQS